MSAVKIADNIYWVGAVDFDSREFHGYEIPYGTTYNAYLIVDEKITLIDTVKEKFSNTLIQNISEIVDPARIDYVLANHVEPDHSGGLDSILDIAKAAQLITCSNGEKGLRAYYHQDWNFKIVKSGDILNTGRYNLEFIQTPMVHWPDNMMVYLEDTQMLFSNDAFGQHYASKERFDFEVDEKITLERAKDYYANIVLPFDAPVKKIFADLEGKDISMILPSHGLILKNTLTKILGKYKDWSDNITNENEAVIVYDSMWGSTKEMAEKIAEDFEKKGIQTKTFYLKEHHVSEIMSHIIEAKYICVGSSTLNRQMLPNVAAFLTYMKGLAPKNRIGLAFGSYGWSGESIKYVNEELEECKFEMMEPIKRQYKN
ncbi:MAG: FprA family A-type flavoprotein [Clostridiales bacterium]|nr:FprA family A-type flavoprotein [Clostridiales bacterium]